MTLHVEELTTRKIENMVKYSGNIFNLSKVNVYVKRKAEEYAEQNNAKKAGEYFILNNKLNKKINQLILNEKIFKR